MKNGRILVAACAGFVLGVIVVTLAQTMTNWELAAAAAGLALVLVSDWADK